jgi:hypothetical protein
MEHFKNTNSEIINSEWEFVHPEIMEIAGRPLTTDVANAENGTSVRKIRSTSYCH